MWINDLADYYKHSKPAAIQIKMMLKVYADTETPILEAASEAYMMENEYFPSVAAFRPYVDIASQKSEYKKIRRVHRYTDDDIYAWELERGTMRTLADIAAEIEADRIKLVAIRDEVTG